MARQIQRYEVTLIGEVCPSDRGRWCQWEDVAPYITVENFTDNQQPQAAIALLLKIRDYVQSPLDGTTRQYIIEQINAVVAQQK
jgi:hypothetical protein